jgi:hypothetical protein
MAARDGFLVDLAQAILVNSSRTRSWEKNGSQEAQEDQADQESPEGDKTSAAQKDQQVRQIKTANKIAGGRRGAF